MVIAVFSNRTTNLAHSYAQSNKYKAVMKKKSIKHGIYIISLIILCILQVQAHFSEGSNNDYRVHWKVMLSSKSCNDSESRLEKCRSKYSIVVKSRTLSKAFSDKVTLIVIHRRLLMNLLTSVLKESQACCQQPELKVTYSSTRFLATYILLLI